MVHKLNYSELDVKGKKVLVRVDFNVPFDNQGHITDDTRISSSLPTIQDLLARGASVILMSHLGRPKGKRTPHLSLAPVAKHLSNLLKIPVIMATDSIGPKVKMMAENLKPGEVMLLENLRFHLAEENPSADPNFAKELASLGNCYVNDAFGTAHRAHSSTVEITKYFPDKSATGSLMEKELEFLSKVVSDPKHPFCAIIGGSKISTKLGVLKSLIKRADIILIGGGMAYTFFKAKGIPIGGSLHEEDLVQEAKEILKLAEGSQVKFILPIDSVITDHKENHKKIRTVDGHAGIPQGWQGVDIGPKTIELFKTELASAKTVFWNGPLGVFEIEEFSVGTKEIAQFLATLHATTIVGGGDSLAAIKSLNIESKISHLSTGGGASLEFIEYETLPGVEALTSHCITAK